MSISADAKSNMTRQQLKHDDLIVVGGGIIGLATAYRMLQIKPGLRLRLIEKESQLAIHQTARNSGVIHSGLYYKPGSMKAGLCLSGSQELISFCETHSIPHEVCGKIVVATSPVEQLRLEQLRQRGLANGLTGLRLLGSEELREREPNCAGLSGLVVPQTGIVNYQRVAGQLADLIVSLGGDLQLGARVTRISSDAGDDSPYVRVETDSDVYSARCVVACAGLQSDRLARHQDPDLAVRIVPFRGEYYQLKKSAEYLVNDLIYPVPDPAFPFLGVHFTRLIDGGIECGPNAVLSLAREGYSRTAINMTDLTETLLWPGFRSLALRYWREGLNELWRSWSKPAFVRALQRLVPAIQEDDLIPGGAGIRAQACDSMGQLVDDFFIKEHGRILHVCNAPSPAATASLAIASYLSNVIKARLEE
jgi:L-2-hydroxyglutarate oxidase